MWCLNLKYNAIYYEYQYIMNILKNVEVRMKRLLMLLLLVAEASLFANAGVFRGSGQTVVLDSTAKIQMVEEIITMTPMRGHYPVDSSCRNMDPMKFHCVFKLRNLTDQTAMVQVGFPISTEALWFRDGSQIHQTEVIAGFGFVAGTREKSYPVRYVPFDQKKKFSNIFLWDMTFQPKQEIELVVCYTMHGYLGMAHTRRGNKPWERLFKHTYLKMLEVAAGEGHQYVTETGKSWAGKIEKATFRITPFAFEKYLSKRGAFEEKLEKPKKKDPGRQIMIDLLAAAPMVRNWLPDYKKWSLVKDKRGRDLFLELVYAPFEPKSKADDLSFFYVFPCIPMTAENFDLLLDDVKKKMEEEHAMREKMLKFWTDAEKKGTYPAKQIKTATEHWRNLEPYSPAVERNLADVILEFYGIRRNNPEIRDFLELQCWYPAEPRPIEPELKERLLKADTVDTPSGKAQK